MPSRDARNDGKKNAIVLIAKDVLGMDEGRSGTVVIALFASSMYCTYVETCETNRQKSFFTFFFITTVSCVLIIYILYSIELTVSLS